ncbi:MAG: CHAP domain-containing protein [Segniliparus sp.]|uniref:CHAP domain-containing protein n=1 Tax=Segniliparus sp. TaxID=2804064 RepID=UPI003F2FB837
MRPTKSQFDEMRPVVLEQAVQSVGSLSGQLGGAVAQIEGAQRTVDSLLLGQLGDTTRELVVAKTADLHRELDNLSRIQSGLANAASEMSSATNNVRSTLQLAESLGYGVNDDWSLRPDRPARPTMRMVSDAKELQSRVVDAVNAWDAADRSAADQARKAIEEVAGKAAQQQKDGQQEAGGQAETGGAAPGGGPSGPAADVAKGYLGRNASDLKGAGIGMDPGIPSDICCANFVSAVLRQSGQIDWHTNGVADLSARLQAQGWHVSSNPPPGAVAIINGSQHTELVASNNGGHVTLIGSNNINGDGTQRVSYGNPYGNIVYLVPPG